MIYRKMPDEGRLTAYASETEGEFLTEDGEGITYRLAKLPELALLGKQKELERELEAGAPVLGLDMEILARLEKPMYLKKKVDDTGWFDYFYYEVPGEKDFYTTLDTAVCGGQYEVLQMLIARGAPFDLRCHRLREIYSQCRCEKILKLAFEKQEYHWERLDYFEIVKHGSGSNIRLLELMCRKGIPLPEHAVSDYKMRFYGSRDSQACEEDPVMKFLLDQRKPV